MKVAARVRANLLCVAAKKQSQIDGALEVRPPDTAASRQLPVKTSIRSEWREFRHSEPSKLTNLSRSG